MLHKISFGGLLDATNLIVEISKDYCLRYL